MSNVTNLVNETFAPQEEYKTKVDEYHSSYCEKIRNIQDTYKGDVLEKELEKAYQVYNDLRETALNEAEAKYNTLIDRLKEYVTNKTAISPDAQTLNVLSAYSMRSNLSRGDVEIAARVCGGSIIALSTLRDIVNRISPDLITYVPDVVDIAKVENAIENQRMARIESMREYMKELPGQTSANSEIRSIVFDPGSGLHSFFDAMFDLDKLLRENQINNSK